MTMKKIEEEHQREIEVQEPPRGVNIAQESERVNEQLIIVDQKKEEEQQKAKEIEIRLHPLVIFIPFLFFLTFFNDFRDK